MTTNGGKNIGGEVAINQHIRYPYLPEDATILYVSAENAFMAAAREHAREFSLDQAMPNASVIVKDGEIIGQAANGSTYHQEYGCERIRLNVPTGQGYDLCEGCSPKNHGEPRAIIDALNNGHDTEGADLFLWGHWWCCKPCWEAIKEAGIRQVYLLKGSERLFNKDDPANIVGKQFA